METYGKMCGSAMQHLKTAQRMQAAASGDLSLRPWYERDFTTKAKRAARPSHARVARREMDLFNLAVIYK
jgi:hypothetical protein